MRKYALATLAIACTALLLTQILGLHLHVEGAGQPGGSHAVHPQHEQHGDEVDGSKLELGNVWSKVLPLFLLFSLLSIPAAPHSVIRLFAARQSRLRRAPLRWRPPLRAPPNLA